MVEQIEQAAKLNLALSILWPTSTSTEKHTLNTFLDQSAQTAGHPSRRQPRLAFVEYSPGPRDLSRPPASLCEYQDGGDSHTER